MSPTQFYRSQADAQQLAADDANLQNVRERCERAANAWTALADRSEKSESARTQAATDKLMAGADDPADRGVATL